MRAKWLIFCIVLALFALPFAKAATAQVAGTMRYNSSAGKMEFFNGLQWYYFAAGLALTGCSKAGQMDYNSLLGVYQVCNGSLWVPVAGTLTLSICSSPGTMDFDGSTFKVCNGLLWADIKGPSSSS